MFSFFFLSFNCDSVLCCFDQITQACFAPHTNQVICAGSKEGIMVGWHLPTIIENKKEMLFENINQKVLVSYPSYATYKQFDQNHKFPIKKILPIKNSG